jgi:hypothetical protein
MTTEPWWVTRRRELEATAPARRKKPEPFVKVPLGWVAAAAKATRSPAIVVCTELLYLSWKARSPTFKLPNGRLGRLGVSRETKRRVLRALEDAGLIKVDRPVRKTPVVTLLLS